MNVLVTGGAGYIGSHAAQRLVRDGHTVVILDNLSRGHAAAVERLRAGADHRLRFVYGDAGQRNLVESLLEAHAIEAVMHFAGLTYVGESMQHPLRYYRENAAAALALVEACQARGVARFVFSSSAAVYGEPSQEHIPIPETCPLQPISPYGASKQHVERMLIDHAAAARAAGVPFACAILRYFNVAGCDRSGHLGEDHRPETHLIPVVLQAALGLREAVTIHGTDYPTPDGTCIRDYIHVEDLVEAHVRVMEAMTPGEPHIYNLGIGRGYSVREIIEAASRVVGQPIPIRAGPRRAGDPPVLYADPSRIARELGWTARITDPHEIIASAWAWFRRHPQGYTTGF